MNDIVAKMRGEFAPCLAPLWRRTTTSSRATSGSSTTPASCAWWSPASSGRRRPRRHFKMAAGDREAMKAYNEQQTRQLNDLIGLVQGKIDKVQRRA